MSCVKFPADCRAFGKKTKSSMVATKSNSDSLEGLKFSYFEPCRIGESHEEMVG